MRIACQSQQAVPWREPGVAYRLGVPHERMFTTQVDDDGEISVPEDFWRNLRWPSGTVIAAEIVGDALLLRPVRARMVEELIGCTQYRGNEQSVEVMEAAIEQGVLDSFDRD